MSNLQRIDPHTLRNLRPEDYRFVGAFDNAPERDCDDYLDQADRHSLAADIAAQLGDAPAIAEHWRARLAARAMHDGHWNRTDGGGRCDHCGARLRYVAVLEHRPTAQLVPVGETCLDNRFGEDTADYLDRLRGESVARRERLALQAQRAAWTESDPRHAAAVAYLRERATDTTLPVSSFVDSIAERWSRRATVQLSPKQVDALLRMRDQEAAHRSKADAPEGRVQITGEVQRAKERPGFRGRTEVKLTVRDDRGFTVWVTRTAAIGQALGWDHETYAGARITFTATLARSDRDSTFAFASRATQVTVQHRAPAPVLAA
ncbi:hypothetical protein AB0M46_13550 [Dactylosporangium sp. NPDC051485]|uniref:hypothetical protein n=1 Tax=Dactylosporangium sp. NPDC051485 TaxID=3154846 RepID=UPI0034159280